MKRVDWIFVIGLGLVITALTPDLLSAFALALGLGLMAWAAGRGA